MPGEGEPHERTIMCWPVRDDLWGVLRPRAVEDYATIARSIAAFEPVTMIAPPGRAEEAEEFCGTFAEVVELPIDDSWARDVGPVYLVDDDGLVVLDPRFNGWGGKYGPHDEDDALAGRWAERRGERVRPEEMVLEGGSITVDGAGTLVTTEQCLLHPNRNPTMTRTDIEEALRRALGVSAVVWIPFGLALDRDTDGHVDNVAAFVEPGLVLVQGCDDPAEADHERLAIDRRCLEGTADARGEALRVVEVPVLPFTTVGDLRVVVPYLNLYVCNGGVIVPTCGHPADEDMLGVVQEAFPGRTVVAVPGEVLAFGGGGPHCITQQVPASPRPVGEAATA